MNTINGSKSRFPENAFQTEDMVERFPLSTTARYDKYIVEMFPLSTTARYMYDQDIAEMFPYSTS